MTLGLFFGVTLLGQTRISGIVKDTNTQKEIYNLTVLMLETGQEVQTDRIGYFQFVDVESGVYTLQISGVGYQSLEKTVEVKGESRIELGDLMVTFNPSFDEVGIITLTSDELDDDESSAQSSVGLLQSSKDVFASTAAYDLGAYWFRVRGYDNKYNDVFFNGIKMNKIDNGRVTFNNWGGLNDITRRPAELTYGLEPSTTAFGDIGGVTNFDTRPSMLRKGVSLSYSLTNRSYRNRIMATYNTGLLKNGWGFTFSGSRRWADEGRIDGTLYDAWAYYLGVEKRFNNKHTLYLTAFGAPNRRATNSPNTKEVTDLVGTGYNSYWGWQDGEKRSERIKKTHEPIAMLTHLWNFNLNTKLTTSVAYQFGTNSGTRLDWDNANNPSPTYYKNMPSYYLQSGIDKPEVAEVYTQRWQNGTIGQLNWSSLYGMNHLRNLQGKSAAYVLAEDFQDDQTMTFSTNLSTKLDKNIDFIVAASYQNTTSENYREVADLLGGNHFSNVDDFATPGTSGQFDEDNPNREIKKGDKYQYNYEINRQYADLFIQTKMNWDAFTWTLGMTVSTTSFYRDGKFRHYLYLDNSKGKSETYDFWNYGIKSNLLYKIDGRNFLALNGQYSTNAPTADEVFANARSNDLTVSNLENAEIFAGEFSYILRAPKIKGRATAFYTLAKNEMEKSFGYIDNDAQTFFAAEVLTDVEKEHLGGEIAVEAQVTPTISVNAVASIGQYTYKNNPNYYLFSDDIVDGGVQSFGKSYLANYHLANGPQQGYSMGIEYRSPQYWWLGVNGNYLVANYLDIAPFNRTSEFASLENNPTVGEIDEQTLRGLLKQHKISDEFMLNVNAGKTFRFGKYYIGVGLTVNNVLNNKNYVTGGFEQMRGGSYSNMLDENYRQTFGPKMWYDQGTSYFLNVFLRF